MLLLLMLFWLLLYVVFAAAGVVVPLVLGLSPACHLPYDPPAHRAAARDRPRVQGSGKDLRSRRLASRPVG